MKLLIIGAGAFGSAMAQELATNQANQVKLLFREEEDMRVFNQSHINERYFPNRPMNSNIKGTTDWGEVAQAEVLFLATPTKSLQEVLMQIKAYLKSDTIVVNLAKGIYEDGSILTDFIARTLGQSNVVSLKGPSFAVEMINQQATLLTLGYSTKEQLQTFKQITDQTKIYLDYTTDIRGVEMLSAIKNVYAILMGSVDARYDSANTRFLVMTKAISELRLILRYLGGHEQSLFLACGLGDFQLTALNDLSRNRTLGLLIGKGFYNPSYESNSVVLEGVKTLKLLHKLIPESLLQRLPLLQQMTSFFLKKTEDAMDLNFNRLFKNNFKTVLTYGTFDLLHFGHLEILRRARELGDRLVVGLSSDEFNRLKNKECKFPYAKRKALLESLSYVDLVFPENNWEQKAGDVQKYEVDVFVMGSDWEGKFDSLKSLCEVYYLPRTKGISTTLLKKIIKD